MVIKTSVKDIFFTFSSKIVSFAYNIVLLPLIMIYLEPKVLGLWYVFLNIGTISTLFTFGFNPSFARNIAYIWSGATNIQKGEWDNSIEVVDSQIDSLLLSKLIASCKLIYGCLGAIAILIILPIGSLYIGHITKDITINYLWISWIIYIISTMVSLIFGYFDAFLLGFGKVEQSQKSIMIAKILQLSISAILLILDFGILSIAIGSLVNCIAYRFMAHYFFKKTLNSSMPTKLQSKIKIKDCFSIIRNIWPTTWREGLIQISSYLTSQASTIVCSLYMSLEATGVFSIYVQISNFIVGIAYSVYAAMQPSFQCAIVIDDRDRLKNIYGICEVSYFVICFAGALAFAILGVPILNFFMAEKSFSISIGLLVILYYILLNHHTMNASVISNYNTLPYVRAFISSGIISVLVACIALVTLSGNDIVIIMFAQIFVQLVYNNWRWPLTACYMVGIKFFQAIKLGIENILEKVFRGYYVQK